MRPRTAARPAVGARQAMTSSTPTRTTASGTSTKAFPWKRLKEAPVLRDSWKSRVPITWIGSAGQPGHRPPLGELIGDHHRHHHGHGHQQPPDRRGRPAAAPAHRRFAGQRRDSPPLLQATHSRANGRARSRAFGMGW